MKQILFLVFIFSSALLHSQIVEVQIFYSSDWLITDPQYFRNYRNCSWNVSNQSFEGSFQDFAIGNKKTCEGKYLGGKLMGPIKYYDNDGFHYRTSFFNSGVMDSVHYFQKDANGEQSLQQSIIVDGEAFYVRHFTDSLGNDLVINGSGLWYMEQPGSTVLEGRFENGVKEGTWRYRRDNGQIILMEYYRKGKFKEAQFYSSNGSETLTKSSFNSGLFDDQILERVNKLDFDLFASKKNYPELHFLPEESVNSFAANSELKKSGNFIEARYPGQERALGYLLSTNLRYPEADKRKGVEGKVYVGFIIGPDGSPSNLQVLKGVSTKCDEEALRVLSLMTPWEPATLDGQAVASKKIVPITFRLVNR